MKTLITTLAAIAALALVGCNSGGGSGAPSGGANGNAKVDENLQKAKVPDEAKQAIANMTQNLPPGAARPVVQPDGTIKVETPGKK